MDWRSTNFFLFEGINPGQADFEVRLAQVEENFRGFLDAWEEFGLNTVSLTWFNPVNIPSGEIVETYAPDVRQFLNGTPSEEVLLALSEIAKDRGFQLIWKPHFITNDSTSANVTPFFVNDPSFNVGAFLDNVNRYWADLAPLAQTANVDLLVVGTEHESYAGPAYDAEWREIIQTVRNAYSGEVTYDALSYVERGSSAADDITFWDALDYIGISMYLPLANDSTPTLAEAYFLMSNNEIISGSTPPVNVPASFQALSEKWGKDIIFTEAGSMARVGALASPPASTGPFDLWEQSVLYAVNLDTFSQYDWFQGFNWWNNVFEFASPPGTEGWPDWFEVSKTEFGFLGKPSGDLVRAFWADGNNGAPISGDVILGDIGNDTLTGGPFDDVIVASRGNDVINGGNGHDRLMAGDGSDFVRGESGNDIIYGGSSHLDAGDRLFGGTGNDLIRGGYGDDFLNGEDGNDVLDGGPGFGRSLGGSGADVFIFDEDSNFQKVSDFEDAIDQIRLTGINESEFDARVAIFSADNGAWIARDDGAFLFLVGLDKDELTFDDFIFDDSIIV